VGVTPEVDVLPDDLVEIAEREASCELWGILKRPDEKYVTERAYENPKFVEDLVRDIAITLQADHRFKRYSVQSENFESIHNHSAYARLEGPQPVAQAADMG
jgi:GTP cyclohydrolase I